MATLRGWQKQNAQHLLNKKSKAMAKKGWWKALFRVTRQRDIVFIIMILSLIGNVLQFIFK